MTTTAPPPTILRCLVISPSDVEEGRQAVLGILQR